MKISAEQFFTGGYSNSRNHCFNISNAMGESEISGTAIINVISKNKYYFPDLKTDYKHTKLKLWIECSLKLMKIYQTMQNKC